MPSKTDKKHNHSKGDLPSKPQNILGDAVSTISKQRAILVLGMHRSGTSAITGTLGHLGAQMPKDPLPPIPGQNSTGYWESAAIVATHNKLLDEVGLRWDMPMLNAITDQSIINNLNTNKQQSIWINTLASCVETEFDTKHPSASPIVIKDPRMCRLVPVWKSVFNKLDIKPLAILPIRNPVEVAASLHKRDNLEVGRSLWIWLDHTLRAEFDTRDIPRVFVRYSCLLDDWRSTIARLNDRLGLNLQIETNADRVDQFLSKEHRHHSATPAQMQSLPRMVSAAFAEFDSAAATSREPNHHILDEIAREFNDMCLLSGSWITTTQQAAQQATEQARQEVSDLNQKLTQSLAKSTDQEKTLASVVESHKSQSQALNSQLDAQGQTLEKSQSDLAIARSESAQAKLAYTALDTQLTNAQELIHTQRIENDNLQQEQSQDHAYIEQLAKQAESDEEQLATLESTIQDSIASLNKELHRSSDLQQDLAATQQDLAASQMDLAASQQEHASAAARAQSLDSQLSSVLNSSTPSFILRKLRASHHDQPTQTQILGRRAAFALRMLRITLAKPTGFKIVQNILALTKDPAFDLVWYRDNNQDLLYSGLHPAEHYILFGQKEGRHPNASVSNHHTLNDSREPSQQLIDCARRTTQSCNQSFSIVMPTWNRKEVITKAIDSIINQSFKSWSLIIADDGSTDNTHQFLLSKYPALFESKQITFLPAKHAGVSAARNRALDAATADWIAYLDTDNTWHEHYLLITAAGYLGKPSLRTSYAALSVNDHANNRQFIRASQFNWSKLANQNFIDLNIFSHDRNLYQELGGFDESLTRLVDWDLILRYTRQHTPKFNRPVLAQYYIDKKLSNISLTEPLEKNKLVIDRRTLWDRIRSSNEPLRLAYVLWDFPALSQTFVIREIKWMIEQGHDVKVYFKVDPDKATQLDFAVDAYRVKDHKELAKLLVEHNRNWAHTHFLYPAATLLLSPACEKAAIPFSIMPHAVDIFHHENRTRNNAAKIAKSDLCKRIVVYGNHHRDFLVDQGVPPEKFIFTLQASDAGRLAQNEPRPARDRSPNDPLRVVSIGRFIDKKGFADLLEALHIIQSKSDTKVELTLFGYGPLDEQLRQYCQQHNLNNVTFASTFEGPDGLRDAFKDADVFCLPCVEADNGDVDGFPTVFIEAAWYGLPILTTTVSAIPDYFTDGFTAALVPPNNPQALAHRLQIFANASQQDLNNIANRAHTWATKHTGPDRTGHRLLDIMVRPPIDIFMVTYHPDNLSNWQSTDRAIQSVLKNTSTPFRLTIVDNASCEKAKLKLRDLVAQNPDSIRLIPLKENIGCGPASNIALENAQSDIVIYLCSNEALASKFAWERPIIEAMRDNPQVAMGGQLIQSPAWANGQSLPNHESFTKFRNTEFANKHPNRTFRHIQGGIWALRRSIYTTQGGFNNQIPQGGMDVEYSFYLESIGQKLLDIPEIICLSNKSRPTLAAQIDETTTIIHPVFKQDLHLVKACNDPNARRCNICDWLGTTSDLNSLADPTQFNCPSCNATSTDRAAYRWLARSEMPFRNLKLGIIVSTQSPGLTTCFKRAAENVKVQIIVAQSNEDPILNSCNTILDTIDSNSNHHAVKVAHCSQMLGIGTTLLVAYQPQPTSQSQTASTDQTKSEIQIKKKSKQAKAKVSS